MSSLATRLSDLVIRFATECKSLRTSLNGNVSDLSALNTTTKTNLVAALNEVNAALKALPAGVQINDAAPSAAATYSSNKINTAIDAAIAKLVGGAPAALDTIAEIAAQLAADEAGATQLATSLGNRVRFDDVQNLTVQQKLTALANIGAAAVAHSHVIGDVTGLSEALATKVNKTDVGNTDTDFVQLFNQNL